MKKNGKSDKERRREKEGLRDGKKRLREKEGERGSERER